MPGHKEVTWEWLVVRSSSPQTVGVVVAHTGHEDGFRLVSVCVKGAEMRNVTTCFVNVSVNVRTVVLKGFYIVSLALLG